jgi:TolB protein
MASPHHRSKLANFAKFAKLPNPVPRNHRIMRRTFPLLALASALLVILTARAEAQAPAPDGGAGPLTMQIVGGGQASPIAVSALKNNGGDDDNKVSSVFVGTVVRDLTLSGFFRVIDPHSYIEDPNKSGYDIGQFNFADWSSLNAEFLVKGAATHKGDAVTIEAMLFDVGQQRRMMGKRFSGEPHDVSDMARRFADAVIGSVTGKRGPFDTKLAFVSTRGGRFKEVYTSWLDGGALYKVTDNPTINLFPSFDRDAHHLLYLSYKTMSPALYLVDLGGSVESRIDPPLGMPVGGAMTPDGRIVGAFSKGGRTNLFLLDASGNELRRLTDTSGINVNPSICTKGKRLAFTSDRSGNPQIYVMDLDGAGAKRVTYSGDYNTAPALSPDCKRIVYESRSGGAFSLYEISADGGSPRLLTDEGSNESPSWSPDGRYVAFSSTRGGGHRVYLMLVDEAKVISPLTEGEGNDTSPSWSWWVND